MRDRSRLRRLQQERVRDALGRDLVAHDRDVEADVSSPGRWIVIVTFVPFSPFSCRTACWTVRLDRLLALDLRR